MAGHYDALELWRAEHLFCKRSLHILAWNVYSYVRLQRKTAACDGLFRRELYVKIYSSVRRLFYPNWRLFCKQWYCVHQIRWKTLAQWTTTLLERKLILQTKSLKKRPYGDIPALNSFSILKTAMSLDRGYKIASLVTNERSMTRILAVRTVRKRYASKDDHSRISLLPIDKMSSLKTARVAKISLTNILSRFYK